MRLEQLPADRWEVPALGVWSLRDLVGHTSSAGLRAVIATLDRPAGSEDITAPEGYHALARSVDRATYELLSPARCKTLGRMASASAITRPPRFGFS